MSILESVFATYIRLFRRRPFLTAFVIILYFAIALSFTFIAKQEKEKLSDPKYMEMVTSDLIRAIQPGLNIDALSEQVKIIFSSYDRKAKGALSEYGLVSLLEDVFTKISIEPKEKEKLGIVMQLIQKQKEKDPYYGLKFEQEVIVKNLERDMTQTDASNGYVEQVKEVIRRQNTEIDELKKSNKWGIPVGIAGIVLTVIFGIMGLVYPVLGRNKG